MYRKTIYSIDSAQYRPWFQTSTGGLGISSTDKVGTTLVMIRNSAGVAAWSQPWKEFRMAN